MNTAYGYDPYADSPVSESPVNVRAGFLRQTYLHLGAAIVLFVGIEALLLQSGLGLEILKTMAAMKWSWILLMVAFIAGGYAAQYMARSNMPMPVQYLGLFGYVVLQALIMLPILVISENFPEYAGRNLALQAGICTLLVFGALTFVVVATGKDFSFLRPFLMVASFAALGFILVSVFLGGPSLGLGFIVLMLVLGAGYILYDTSNVMHHMVPGQHVAAALELFASVAMLYYYMLRLFMSYGRGND